MTRALRPNSTQIPDIILDFWLSELSGAELKVVLYIARRTYGFGKESDNISLTQICTGIKKRDGTVLDTGTGLSRSSVARAIKTLEDRDIILRKVNVSEASNEHEESTYSLNLNWQPNPGSGRGGQNNEGRRGGEEEKGVVPKSNHLVSKREGRWSQNRTTPGPRMKPEVVPKSNPQQTEQETVQETAAEKGSAVLVEKLVACGLNRREALRFAEEKPEECRRQLDYIRYRIQTGYPFRSGPGAFLRRAIEAGFSAPSGYEKSKRDEAQMGQEKARIEAELAYKALQRDHLRQILVRMEKEQPGAFFDFMAFVEARKQEAICRPILHNAPEVKERLLKTFDTEETRLELLTAYLQENPCLLADGPGNSNQPASL